MAKTPGKRHSGSNKEPVTIDLASDDIKHIDDASTTESDTTESDLAAQDNGAGEPASTADEDAMAEDREDAASDDVAVGALRPAETPSSEADEETELTRAAQDYGAGDAGESGAESESVEAQTEEKGSVAPGQPQQRSGVFPAIGGGIVGALIAAAAVYGASYAGLIPTGTGGNRAEVEQLKTELATMRDQLTTGETASKEAPAGVAQALEEARGGIDSLTQSIATLQHDLADLKQAVSSGNAGSGTGALSEASAARLADLENRIGAIDEAVETLKQAAADASGKAKEAANMAAKAAGTADQAATAANEAGGRIAALETRISDLAGKVSEGSGQEQVARAVAATALKSAIDRGAPFMGELETFASVAGASEAIDSLRGMAAGGVPTRGEISEEAPAAAYAMIEAGQAPPSDASLLDRLTASAKSLIKVRPTGNVEGESVAAVAARIEAAVKRGDYAKALDEYDGLPDAPKRAGASFATKVKARMEADLLVEDVLSSALNPQN